MIEMTSQSENLSRPVKIPVGPCELDGDLSIPAKATGIVLFVHGSGSSRHSPRNRYVAEVLQRAGIGTLLFDLLTEQEDEVYQTRFNIDLLTRRLIAATTWLEEEISPSTFPLGYFGASTGAAAALAAASKFGSKIRAIVSRGGRPDLADEALTRVESPTLLIVGGNDDVVIEMNRRAMEQLICPKKLAVVPGATHLFAEPGTLEQVAQLATDWFLKYASNKAKKIS